MNIYLFSDYVNKLESFIFSILEFFSSNNLIEYYKNDFFSNSNSFHPYHKIKTPNQNKASNPLITFFSAFLNFANKEREREKTYDKRLQKFKADDLKNNLKNTINSLGEKNISVLLEKLKDNMDNYSNNQNEKTTKPSSTAYSVSDFQQQFQPPMFNNNDNLPNKVTTTNITANFKTNPNQSSHSYKVQRHNIPMLDCNNEMVNQNNIQSPFNTKSPANLLNDADISGFSDYYGVSCFNGLQDMENNKTQNSYNMNNSLQQEEIINKIFQQNNEMDNHFNPFISPKHSIFSKFINEEIINSRTADNDFLIFKDTYSIKPFCFDENEENCDKKSNLNISGFFAQSSFDNDEKYEMNHNKTYQGM